MPEHETFTRIYDEQFESIYRYIYWLTLDDHLTRDILQNTFEALWVTISQKKKNLKNPAAWLYRVAHNKLTDYYRAEIKLNKKKNSLAENFSIEEIERKQNISLLYEYKEMETELSRILSSLDYPLNSIIYCIDVEKYTYSQVIKKFNLSERTIRKLRKKAWNIIKKELESLSFPEDLLETLPA